MVLVGPSIVSMGRLSWSCINLAVSYISVEEKGSFSKQKKRGIRLIYDNSDASGTSIL